MSIHMNKTGDVTSRFPSLPQTHTRKADRTLQEAGVHISGVREPRSSSHPGGIILLLSHEDHSIGKGQSLSQVFVGKLGVHMLKTEN